jgi:hypothetical protein
MCESNSRRSGFLASVADGVNSANLTPASRRQDHTASPSALAPFVIGAISVHRIPSRVRDDREPPLWGDGMAAICEVIWVWRKPEYFCQRDWTGKLLICPPGIVCVLARLTGTSRNQKEEPPLALE